MEINKDTIININLQEWDYTCGDGCCYMYGTKIYVNGQELEEDGHEPHALLYAILNHLGYKNVNINYIE